jgi:signal transduction histidine kinase
MTRSSQAASGVSVGVPLQAQAALQAWRSRAGYVVLLVVAVASLPSYVYPVVAWIIAGRITALVWIYGGVYAGFVILAALPRLDPRARSVAFFCLAYASAVGSFARLGLIGSGRLYLLVLPVLATILVGAKGGYLTTAVSLTLYVGFTVLARLGILSRWAGAPTDVYALSRWVEAGGALAVFLVTVMVLVERFHALYVRTLKELELAYETLEQRVRARTAEVQTRTRELELLNSVAAVVSGSLDLGEILNAALEKTMAAFDIETGAAYGLDESASTLVLLAHRGLSEGFVRYTAGLPLEVALGGKQLSLEHPLTWSIDEYPEGEFKERVRTEGLQLIIAVPLSAKGNLVGGLVVNSRSDRVLTPGEESLLVAVGQQIGLAVENARLFELERARHGEAERRREVAEGMRDVMTVLNSDQPLQVTLERIITHSRRLMGSDAAALLQIQSGDGSFRIQAACGLDDDYIASIRFSPGKGGAGRAVTARRPVVLPDAAAFVRRLTASSEGELAEEAAGLELMMNRGFLALLSVPLVVEGEAYGGITLYYRQARGFSEEELELARTVADQAALAIENARLRGRAGEAAAFAERSRLARELHDSVTQSLYSVTLYAEAVARMLKSGGNQAAAAEHLGQLRVTAQEALREMRLLIFELSPPALEKGSLADALQTRLDAVEARGGMAASLQVEGTERLSAEQRRELYQIAQEALNNALKHSRAQSVRVRLVFGETETLLEVSDDGAGFEPGSAGRSGGLGLRGMSERVKRITGVLRVESTPGRGTTVSVRLPADLLPPSIGACGSSSRSSSG